MSAAIINSVGLFLDIVGVILLFFFARPSRVSEEPPSELISFGSDPDSTKQWEKQRKRYKFWSGFALVLLILGFAIQMVSNHPKFIELLLMR